MSSVTKDAAGITDTLSRRPRRIPLLSCPRARPPSTRQRGSGQLEVQLGGSTSTGPLDLPACFLLFLSGACSCAQSHH